ncbi:hypothetical protein [Polluticoccus soli]|uniref:hypothetical protein n=1 Tax=Polluticoccus soli TaxID=3034150 RepID=UPI0023E1451E|nr:hypothetical protein [Flavipsychrobacter sp. JY13-12]
MKQLGGQNQYRQALSSIKAPGLVIFSLITLQGNKVIISSKPVFVGNHSKPLAVTAFARQMSQGKKIWFQKSASKWQQTATISRHPLSYPDLFKQFGQILQLFIWWKYYDHPLTQALR